MSTIQERLAAANPAEPPTTRVEKKTRIPMSLPMQKLRVPDLPGYHLHWMLGKADRIEQALAAGYTFVEKGTVELSRKELGNTGASGSDLGSRISVISGTDETGGQPQRLYLMKLPLEFWEEDQTGLAQRNEVVAAALRGEKGFVDPSQGVDNSNRYVPKSSGNKDMFQPKPRRG